MENEIERFPVLRLVEKGDRSNTEILVSREFPLTIIVNGQELVTLLCPPRNLDYLAVGYLASEGFLKSRNEIKKIIVDDQRGVGRLEPEEGKQFAQDVLFRRIISSGCGRGGFFLRRCWR